MTSKSHNQRGQKPPIPLTQTKELEMKYDALNKLHDIRDQIDALADKARDIVDKHFPQQADYAASYCIFEMTSSWNDYNQTFETLIADIAKDLGDD